MARKRIGAVVLPVLVAAALIGCVAGPSGSGTPPSSRSTSAVGSPSAGVEPATRPSVEAIAPPHVPATCELTKPTHPFVPPTGYPAPSRPPTTDAEWYGTARLWTMLDHAGESWIGLPRGTDGSFGQKTFWWSADFDVNHEPQPAIAVTGLQLDGPGRFASRAPGTNAAADFGSAMLTGVELPSTGCWRITAMYRDTRLSYVVWVGD